MAAKKEKAIYLTLDRDGDFWFALGADDPELTLSDDWDTDFPGEGWCLTGYDCARFIDALYPDELPTWPYYLEIK